MTNKTITVQLKDSKKLVLEWTFKADVTIIDSFDQLPANEEKTISKQYIIITNGTKTTKDDVFAVQNSTLTEHLRTNKGLEKTLTSEFQEMTKAAKGYAVDSLTVKNLDKAFKGKQRSVEVTYDEESIHNETNDKYRKLTYNLLPIQPSSKTPSYSEKLDVGCIAKLTFKGKYITPLNATRHFQISFSISK